MLRILIVDDMPIFLEYLRGCIDWATYGFEICGEAHDGKEAIDKIDELYPDIILTDITMPYVDGLELAEYVSRNYSDISVVLITGNNEFEYARRALKIGVCDYIVKPFEKEELIFALLKMQDNINRVLEAKSEHEKMEDQNREHILRKLIMGKHTSWARHMEQFETAGIPFVSDYFLVCTLNLLNTTPDAFEDVANWESVIIKILESKISIDGVCRIFKDYENNIVLLLNFNSEEEMKEYKTYELSDINKLIKDSLHFDTAIGVSGYCYGADSVREAYLQAQRACAIRKSDISSRVYDYKKMDLAAGPVLYSWKSIDSLNQGIETENEEQIKETLREIFDKYEGADNDEHIVLYSGLISILLTIVMNVGKNISTVYGEKFQPYQEILALEDRTLREEKVTEYFLKAVRHEKKNVSTRSGKLVEDVKAYIAAHYMEPDLCIADISRELLINQTYLRSMFKDEMQITISEYLTKYRMQLALDLIQHTDDKFFVISEKVGYSDVSYFGKSFKKYYGVTPKEYRN